jgi:hypothetical protein
MSQAWDGSVQAKVLTNAVSIPTTDPIRVLSYEAGASTSVTEWTRKLLGDAITRQVTFTLAAPEAIAAGNLYASYDVVLVHGAAGNDPAGLGASWAPALQTFTKRGGVFVAIDGGSSDVPSLVNATGLISVTSHQALPSWTHFAVTGANDVVGAKLLSPYAGAGSSVAFDGVDSPSADVTYVVRTDDVASLPTVIHKVAR